jgi:hypothetical protein
MPRAMARARLALAFAALLAAFACVPKGTPPPPAPAGHRAQPRAPELERAVRAWHDHDDIAPLRAWIDRHPQAHDVDVWREVVALADYDACHADAGVDEAGMREVVRRYPDTVAARTAIARLSGDTLGRLRTSIPSRDLVDLLDGGDAWARTDDGALRMPATDLAAFRNAHADELEQALARTLVADRCRTLMGYCNWWIEKRAGAPQTAAIAAARKQAWYDRGHPEWRGGAHARCAARCMKTCRERATALDDGCWTPCYSRCP